MKQPLNLTEQTLGVLSSVVSIDLRNRLLNFIEQRRLQEIEEAQIVEQLTGLLGQLRLAYESLTKVITLPASGTTEPDLQAREIATGHESTVGTVSISAAVQSTPGLDQTFNL